MQVGFERITTNGITLNVRVAGPEDGPLLILLHGFPEAWFAWDAHIQAFAEAGYRVLAPDQRGYNLSEKPAGVRSYAGQRLMEDALGLIDAAGRQNAVVVGHDWGAFVAWTLAMLHPQRVTKLVVMSVPHPKVMKRRLRTDPKQMLRSWYMGMFQIPRLPEFLLGWRRHWLLRRVLRRTSRPGTFTAEDLRRYETAWAQPGALTAMLNWYRAALRSAHWPELGAAGIVTVPVLILWGKLDFALRVEMALESASWCRDAKVEIMPEATHWLHHEEPQRMQEMIFAFLAAAEQSA